jgi:hypothetical protein
MTKQGQLQLSIVKKSSGKVVSFKEITERLEKVNGKYLGEVRVRIGATLSKPNTYSSIVCHVEVALPVSLEDVENEFKTKESMKEGIRRAAKLADNSFNKLSKLP